MSLKDVLAKSTALEGKIGNKAFLGGGKPSAEDVKAFNDLLGAGNLNVFRWVKHMASFSTDAQAKWGAPLKITPPELKTITTSAAKPAAATVKHQDAPKKPEVPKVAEKPASNDDDELDLFGEQTEEEKAALEAKKAKDAEKKKEKKVVIAKSSILMDIKPWDDTIDLTALGQKLKAVVRDGLIWGDSKLVPVAFGVKKLQQLIVIEDDKVSSDDLEDIIMGFEDDVQSMDIVAWNKI